MDKLGKILPRVIARTPNRGRIVEAHVRGAFAAVLGPQLAAMCESIELRGAVLTVRTSSPALAHQLMADSAPLLARSKTGVTFTSLWPVVDRSHRTVPVSK